MKIKVLVFTEGTILMPYKGKNLNRTERVQQVKDGEESVHNFYSYIPVGNAVQKLQTWEENGCEINYLTSRKSSKEINEIQKVLLDNKFPSGTLLYRKENEGYENVVEKLKPDILVEDDCESIGGVDEMTYPKIKATIKGSLKHITVKEFGGIDHLPNNLDQ